MIPSGHTINGPLCLYIAEMDLGTFISPKVHVNPITKIFRIKYVINDQTSVFILLKVLVYVLLPMRLPLTLILLILNICLTL